MAEISLDNLKGKAPGKGTCEECGEPCNIIFDERDLCAKCRKRLKKEYPKGMFNPREDGNFFYNPKNKKKKTK